MIKFLNYPTFIKYQLNRSRLHMETSVRHCIRKGYR